MSHAWPLLALLAACTAPRATAPAPIATPTPTPPVSPRVCGPRPSGTTLVPQAMLEGQRVAGSPHIELPDEARRFYRENGVNRLAVRANLCLDESGSPSQVCLVKPPGHPAAEATIEGELGAWRFRPWVVQGRAVPVCTPLILHFTFQP